jgi:predicted PurR-regulated permease PerM
MLSSALVFATGWGLGFGLIAAVVVAVVLVTALGFWLQHRLAGRSRGGVQPRPREFRRGDPPFESIGRRRGR